MLLSAIVSILFLLCAIAAATHALLSKRDSKSALGWVACCLFIPFAGPFIYLIFGINRIEAKARELFDEDHPQPNTKLGIDHKQQLPRFSIIGKSVTGKEALPYKEYEILENGEALFPRMLQEIDAAKQTVFLASYIFQNDSTGKQFLNALINAKNRGVDVRIIVDGLGAILYPPRIGKSLADAKLNVRYFDPARLVPPSLHINLRNHRKLLIIDQRIGFTGGQNITDRHLRELQDNRKVALDLHFSFSGESAEELQQAFLRDWTSCGQESAITPALPPPAHKSRNNGGLARVVLDGPNENLDRLNELLLGVFSLAEKRIWIMTPYFLPGFELLGALIAARHRGVDVKILLPEKTNIHFTQWATEHGLQHIVSRGLTVLLQPAPFIHTKAIIIDDSYSLIGSANLDPRSLRLNFEIGVEVFSKSFNNDLESYFQNKLICSSRLSVSKLREKPFVIRVRNALAWLFTPYL